MYQNFVQEYPQGRHPDYVYWIDKWIRQRDAIDGEDRVKEQPRDREYLPPLAGQTHSHANANLASYSAYKKRASFHNATARTRDGLVGAILRRPPMVSTPVPKDVLKYVGSGFESFDEIVTKILDEVVGVGRVGALVDAEEGGGGDPMIALYRVENIINWQEMRHKGRRVCATVALIEDTGYWEERLDRNLERVRVLRLGDPADAGTPYTTRNMPVASPVYFQEVWEEVVVQGETGTAIESDYNLTDVIVPTGRGGRRFDYIPFTLFNYGDLQCRPSKPPLLDLTVVNFSHYRNSADMEHGLHFTALPQPWAAGFDFQGSMYIGSGAAWITDQPDARAGYLEFSGAGLGAIREQMDRKERRMAALGARLLEEQAPASAAEAAETVKLRHSGEGSVLARIADNVSRGLKRLLDDVTYMMGISGESEVKLNTDFGVEGLSPQMLTALMQQVQSGLMSHAAYRYNLSRGEMYPENWTDEDELNALEMHTNTRRNEPQPFDSEEMDDSTDVDDDDSDDGDSQAESE